MPLRPRHYLARAPSKGEADPDMDQYGDECAPPPHSDRTGFQLSAPCRALAIRCPLRCRSTHERKVLCQLL